MTFSENRAVYEIMWEKNIVQPGRPQVAIWRMRIAFWIPKATDPRSEYVILIALPLRQWLNECALMLCYTEIGSLFLLRWSLLFPKY